MGWNPELAERGNARDEMGACAQESRLAVHGVGETERITIRRRHGHGRMGTWEMENGDGCMRMMGMGTGNGQKHQGGKRRYRTASTRQSQLTTNERTNEGAATGNNWGQPADERQGEGGRSSMETAG